MTLVSKVVTQSRSVTPLASLGGIWLVVGLFLLYMGITPLNAIVLASSLVGQACLGGWFFIWVSRCKGQTLLLVLGPGLMLGGPISYLLFQVFGRGASGVLAASIAGFLSIVYFTRSSRTVMPLSNNAWVMTQIVAMSALILVTEFVELLPVAIAGFAYGLFAAQSEQVSVLLNRVAFVACVSVCLTAYHLRQEFWWLITDDYQHIEIIMRHLSQSSPFSDWGAFNYGTNYHWLSYAWGGLVNEVSLSKEHFLTMTRIVPAAYSLSLSASLCYISHLIIPSDWRRISIIPIWIVVAFVPLDWSGTSTGGVYAVLAACVAALLQLMYSSERSTFGTFTVLGCLTIVLALTKFPATFAFLLLAGLIFVSARAKTESRRVRNAVTLIGIIVLIVLLFIGLWISSRFLSSEFRLAWRNPGLGQLGQSHPILIALGLVASRLWLWYFTALAVRRSFATLHSASTRWASGASLLFLLVGVTLEMVVTGSVDNHRYFSDPMYFIAAILLLMALVRVSSNSTGRTHSKDLTLIIAVVVIPSLWWGPLSGSEATWKLLQNISISTVLPYASLANYITSDTRFLGSSVLALLGFLYSRLGLPKLRVPLLVGVLVALTLADSIPEWVRDFRRIRSAAEIVVTLGTDESRQIGEWLLQNTSPDDLIATNLLVNKSGSLSSDFSLAVWSERTFLIIGPRFFRGEDADRQGALELSTRWANQPDPKLCDELRSRGVRWFVIDLRLTKNRDWSVCAEEWYRIPSLIALKITPEVSTP